MPTILVEKNIMVPLRNGVRLATDVYRLAGGVPAPVLLSRTPYDTERARPPINTGRRSIASSMTQHILRG